MFNYHITTTIKDNKLNVQIITKSVYALDFLQAISDLDKFLEDKIDEYTEALEVRITIIASSLK